MSDTTGIEWTNSTWNPTSGCERVSPGCDNCYALRFAERFRGVRGHYFENGFDVQLRPNMLAKPRGWKIPRLIFVDSMSDLLHRDIPDWYIDKVFDVMEDVNHHIYQLLTKRPERLRRYIAKRYATRAVPDNIWIGTSVEDNSSAWRADMLRSLNSAVRFLSIEPMLGPVDRVSLTNIDWVIVGGESGPVRRAMELAWVRDIRDRCTRSNIPFFFKQWHKAGTGRMLDDETWDQMPAIPFAQSEIDLQRLS
ncbi:MAG: Phage protein Gp37/Gp68 [Candidatus Eremiobacteraeota bacterium]|nr:Phage protein Gp37/Gp68 [Candidatus Eremiobacteraeota bacterium]